MPRALAAPLVALAAIALAAPARADDDAFQTVTLGLIFSAPFTGRLDQFGIGVHASVMHYPDDRYLGVGGFVQAQHLFGGGWRIAIGAQPAAWVVGAELGVAVVSHRGGPAEFGLHLSPYFSTGYVGFGLRITPLLTARGYGIDGWMSGNLWFEVEDGARPVYDLTGFNRRIGL